MDAEEVRAIVLAELDGDLDRVKVHVPGYVMPQPRLEEYVRTNGSEVSQYWTVLMDGPYDEGYIIYFDPVEKVFGLGMRDANCRVALGSHGSFMETLHSM